MSWLISLSGRKGSGKSMLGEETRKYGYEIINFSTPLKMMICHLLDVDINYLNENKDKMKKYTLHENGIKYLSDKLNISKKIVLDKLEPFVFNSIREIMQIIGTKLIRENNDCWHINEMKKLLNPSKKYCITDCRFPNEKQFIEELGGECWFILNPNEMNISNHISEISLLWDDFNNIILNSKYKNNVIKQWNDYLFTGEKNVIGLSQKIIKNLQNNIFYQIKKDLFKSCVIKKIIYGVSIESESFEDMCKIKHIVDKKIRKIKNGYDICIYNPFIIENLKCLM